MLVLGHLFAGSMDNMRSDYYATVFGDHLWLDLAEISHAGGWVRS